MKRLIVVIFLLIPFLNTAQNLKPYKNEDGLWGFKDSLGFVIIKARFKKVEVFSEGLAAVLDVKKEKWTFVNTKDELIFEPRFKYTPKPFQEGLSIVVGDYTKSDLFYGVINTKGEIVIPPKYSKITGPYKSVYLLTNENKLKYNISDDTYGLALTSGKILSEPIFEDAMNQPDENGWISVKMNGERKYQNIDGRLSDIPNKKKYSGVPKSDYLLLSQKIVNLVTGYTTIIEGKAEFVNDYFIAINGDTLILPTPMGFEYLKTDFGENLIADKEKNKEALIKSNPKLYLAFVKSENVNLSKYYLLSPDGSAKKLSDGYLSRSFDHEYFTILKGEGRVNRDSLYYVIFNNEGKLIGNSIKDYLILNDNSTLIFSINDSIIYYDGKNHASLAYYISAYPSELYSNAIKFHNINELPVKADSNTINFIDINTRKVTISGIQGIKALPFINGKAALLRNGLWGAIDRKLDTIVPFIYTRISESIHYKMLLICNNKGCFDFMKKAEKVINPEDDITVYVKYTFYGQKYSSVDPVYFASVLTKQKYLDDLSVQEYVDSQVINWLTTEGKNWFYDKYIKEKSDPKNFKEVWQRKSVEITSENKWIDFRDLVKEYPEYGVAVIITYL